MASPPAPYTGVTPDMYQMPQGYVPLPQNPRYTINPNTWYDKVETNPLLYTATGNYQAYSGLSPEEQEAQMAYLQSIMPYFQDNRDFYEDTRRWNDAQMWQQALDQYNMGLANRQQGLAESQTDIAANQWNKQFDYTRARDYDTMQMQRDFANQSDALARYQTQQQTGAQRYGYDQNLAGVKHQANQNLAGTKYSADTYSQANRDVANIQADAQRYNTDMMAFGRSMAPTARYVRNWRG